MTEFIQQIAALRSEVTDIKRRRVTHRTVQVTAADPVTSTFSAVLPDGQALTGLSAPAQFLPAVGQFVTLRLEGATPIYDPAGLAVSAVGDRELSGVGAGKLTGGTMSADVTVSGRFTTALTGQRAGIDALGVFAYDASSALTIRLDGVNNLITGTTQSALTGRRIVTGASGSVGRISFIAPNGATGLVESFTSAETGQEATRLALPITGGTYWEGWNGLQFQTNERSYMSSGLMQFYYGGGGPGSQQFQVLEASSRGSGAATLPAATLRLDIDQARSSMLGPDGISAFEAQSNALRMFVGDPSFEGSIDVARHGIADADLRSPRMLFRSEPNPEGTTHAAGLRFAIAADGSNPRFAVSDTAGTGYFPIWASAFTVSSTAELKDEIADLAGSALTRVRLMRPRTYRRMDGGVPGPTEIGLVAEEAPQEIVRAGKAVDLYPLVVLLVAAIKELDQRTIRGGIA